MKLKNFWKIGAVILVLVLLVAGYIYYDYFFHPLKWSYKSLYSAVKSKDPERIKKLMSRNSLLLAEFASSQQKKSVEEVIKNGFTATTFAESLPEMRDERIKDGYGALEVWNSKDRIWEDLPFIKEARVTIVSVGENRDAVVGVIAETLKLEPDKVGEFIAELPKTIDGITEIEAENLRNSLAGAGATVTVEKLGWKFAMGDMFKGSYQKPAPGQAFKEAEAANANNPNLVPAPMPANMNMVPMTNVNVNTAQVKPINPQKRQPKK